MRSTISASVYAVVRDRQYVRTDMFLLCGGTKAQLAEIVENCDAREQGHLNIRQVSTVVALTYHVPNLHFLCLVLYYRDDHLRAWRCSGQSKFTYKGLYH